jgi:hypothetical protein
MYPKLLVAANGDIRTCLGLTMNKRELSCPSGDKSDIQFIVPILIHTVIFTLAINVM